MNEIIKKEENEIQKASENEGLLVDANNQLEEVRLSFVQENTISIPIAELSSLGTAICSMIPSLRKVTHKISFATDGLYRIVNAETGDILKNAKDGNFWGAMKSLKGTSKLAKLSEVESISGTVETFRAPLDPSTMMMAAALYSIQKELSNIEEMQKQIVSFLQFEKESEIEADIETLIDIAKKYTLNWDNEHFVTSNHKQMLDIQRTARKNMIAYQKQVDAVIGKKRLFLNQGEINRIFADLEKKFKYYRLSLYSYSLSSFMEIMLSGNFKEAYINGVKAEILDRQFQYRNLFDKGSLYLEELGGSVLESYLLKGVGVAGETLGKVIGNIPYIKDGNVDEFLQDNGEKIIKTASNLKTKAVYDFSLLNNPGTGIIINKLNDMNRIYNHTAEICVDQNNIYLVQDQKQDI